MSNVVPDYAEIVVDRRVLPNEDINSVIEEFKRMIYPLEVEVARCYNPVELDKELRITKLMQDILKKHKLDNNPIGVRFTTQFSELAIHNIGGFIFGAGSVNQAHKPDEYVLTKDLNLCHDIFLELINKKNLIKIVKINNKKWF